MEKYKLITSVRHIDYDTFLEVIPNVTKEKFTFELAEGYLSICNLHNCISIEWNAISSLVKHDLGITLLTDYGQIHLHNNSKTICKMYVAKKNYLL